MMISFGWQLVTKTAPMDNILTSDCHQTQRRRCALQHRPDPIRRPKYRPWDDQEAVARDPRRWLQKNASLCDERYSIRSIHQLVVWSRRAAPAVIIVPVRASRHKAVEFCRWTSCCFRSIPKFFLRIFAKSFNRYSLNILGISYIQEMTYRFLQDIVCFFGYVCYASDVADQFKKFPSDFANFHWIFLGYHTFKRWPIDICSK